MTIIIRILIIFSLIVNAQTNPIEPLTVEIEELPTAPVIEEPVIPEVLMIDDFEDGEFTIFRTWWSFGKILIRATDNEEKESFLNKKSMNVVGSSSNWYAGGIGTYLNENAEYFDTLTMVLYSPKLNSGTLRIELYDDDNNNNFVDIDEETGKPAKDDIFIYDINLTFQGWKVIKVPLSEFTDFNRNVGDNIWNPNQLYGSSGLAQMQIIVMSSKFDSESIDFKIDTIKLN